MSEPSLERFRRVVAAATANLESRRTEVNDLNVFPVADGDTGDNMALTMKAVLAELDEMGDQEVDEIGRDQLVVTVARAALMGARGNSGVILSQIVRGAAEEFASRPGELIDPQLVAAALSRAVDAAYESVQNPAEGTMLTVLRAMSTAISQRLAHMDQTRLDPATTTEAEQDALLAEIVEVAIEAGEEAVGRTTEQLDVLAEAGVVDAGAHGLVLILAGFLAGLRGEGAEVPDIAPQTAAPRLSVPHHEDSRYRYCTNFIVTGEDLDSRAFIPKLESVGDSVLVVGDEATLKIHVHTDDPDDAVALFKGAGEVQRLDVADMREQVAERTRRLTAGGADGDEPEPLVKCAVIAAASAEGIAELLRGVGAQVVDGGPTMNPSTYELLAGIHGAHAEEVVVLPNSPNVVMAANRAAELSERPAVVVDCTSQQAALAVLFDFNPDQDAEANASALSQSLKAIRTGSVAPAARDDQQGRYTRGDAVGFVGEEIVAWGDPGSTLAETMAKLGEGMELITVIDGDSAPLTDEEISEHAPDGVEVEVHRGGQPHYWWLLAAQ